MACNIKLKKILWARVVWQENENSFFEDVLPANWINEEMGVVFWPSTMSVQRAISENIEVDHESWRKFKWLKTKIVDEDRQLCNDFNFTSCGEQVTTDDEFSNQVTSDKTVKDLTLHSDATSDDDEIVDFIRLNKKRNINSQSPSHHAGAKPNKKSKKEKQQFPLEEESQSQSPSHHAVAKRDIMSKKEKQQFPMEEESQSQSTSHHAVTKRKKKSKKEKQQFPLEEESQSQSPSHCTVTKCDKKSKKEKQPFPMEKGKYQRKSLRYLVEIRDLLSKLVEVKDPENSKFHIEKINNSDQLDELEEVIKDDVQRKAILSKLKNIGGVDMADCTRNMLGKLFSVNLMANMNIKGSKRKGRENKISFENLKLKDVMFEALQDRYTVSEKELFRVVGNKLKNAPGRLNHSIDI
ncbi:transcriptional regulator ATRX homolog isoform X5 [Hydra vulgaris]|uniref:transcriptional regulator ATRX homolog isoform X5 n=1 Tax=Hydra vulgaris TaxID=6087 RepID=UPI0032EA8B1D